MYYHNAEKVIALLRIGNSTIATAESCTGGLLGAAFTDVEGSSQVFLGGIISYSNEAKQEFLQVPIEMLEEFGAVSPQVAEVMARETKLAFHATYGLSTTGIAGPGGGTAEKPVGLVYSAISGPFGVKVFKDLLSGNRETVRTETVRRLLERLIEYIDTEGN